VMGADCDILPSGVINVVNGFGVEAGKPLGADSGSPRLPLPAKRRTGAHDHQYASDNIIPVTLELGGKSPNIFLPMSWTR